MNQREKTASGKRTLVGKLGEGTFGAKYAPGVRDGAVHPRGERVQQVGGETDSATKTESLWSEGNPTESDEII